MQTLYGFLFTIFNCFVTPDTYDGADRHFLKVFLETCAPALRPVLNVNSQVKLHFFLQLFETRVCDRIPKGHWYPSWKSKKGTKLMREYNKEVKE